MAGFFDDERGCQISIHFAGSGTAIKGCAEDAFMSPLSEPPFEPEHRAGLIAYPGVLRNVPEDLLSVISSTNQLRSLTLCVWRAKNDGRWQIGEITWPTNIDDPDGSEDLFAIFAEEQDFSNWLTDLYQADFEPAALKHILENCPLTDSFLSSVGSKRSLSEIKARLLECGYPEGQVDSHGGTTQASASSSNSRPQQDDNISGSTATDPFSALGNAFKAFQGEAGRANLAQTMISAIKGGFTVRPGSPNAEPVISWTQAKRLELMLKGRKEMGRRLDEIGMAFIMDFHADKTTALEKYADQFERQFQERPDFIVDCFSELAETYTREDRIDEVRMLRARIEKYADAQDLPASAVFIYVPLGSQFNCEALERALTKELNAKDIQFKQIGIESPERYQNQDYERIHIYGDDLAAIERIVKDVSAAYHLPEGSIIRRATN
jgi:hypothetical protein